MQTFANVLYCPLWKDTRMSARVCELPANSVLLLTGRVDGDFTEVIFRSSRDYQGWVESVLLDEITHALPCDIVPLDHPTASLQDLAQYVFVETIDGVQIQYNLCGELCVCYIAGVSLATLLTEWRAAPTGWFNRVFQKGKARTTGVPDIINMLSIFPSAEHWNINVVLAQKAKTVITPSRLKELLVNGWKIIVGVNINAQGFIQKTGTIRHWVTISNATPNGNADGWIDFYNPAFNRIQRADYQKFFDAMGTPLGLLVRIHNATTPQNPTSGDA